VSPEKIDGGATGGVEELYREVILDHFKSPKNRGPLPTANARAEGVNPLCGDQISISLQVEDDRLKEIRFEGHGCAISQSAASMMTALVKGKPIVEAQRLARNFKRMFGIEDAASKDSAKLEFDELGDLIALEGVKKYPVRIKCAILSANTLMQSVEDFSKRKGA
jgi:nitrogen fixation protein NifU and related proteins